MATQSLSDPTTGQKIPAFLQGVEGVVFGRSVPTLGQSRIVISSLPKVGKSSLAHSNPKAFALDPESGGLSVRNPAALRFGPMVRPMEAAPRRYLTTERSSTADRCPTYRTVCPRNHRA